MHEIGGVADHVHLLIQWRTDEALATLMRRLKALLDAHGIECDDRYLLD